MGTVARVLVVPALFEPLSFQPPMAIVPAEMFLIFNLLRPNVLPLDDLGVLKAVSLNYFDGAPVQGREGRERVIALAGAWEPWRS